MTESAQPEAPEPPKKFIGFGRPPFYKTPEELQEKIEEYFRDCPDKRKHFLKDGSYIEVPIITISGLVLYLGFADRAAFYDYEKKDDFCHTIKRARTFIEMEYEHLLRTQSSTGAIFALKNFGWIDKSELDTNHTFTNMPTIKKNGKESVFNVGEAVPE